MSTIPRRPLDPSIAEHPELRVSDCAAVAVSALTGWDFAQTRSWFERNYGLGKRGGVLHDAFIKAGREIGLELIDYRSDDPWERNQGITFNRFVGHHPRGEFLVSTSHHVAYVHDGELCDTHDSMGTAGRAKVWFALKAPEGAIAQPWPPS